MLTAVGRAARVPVAVLAAVVGGCSSGGQSSAGGILSIDVPAAGMTPAATDEPARIDGSMAVGERLEVRLGASAGTGYSWVLAGPVPANMQMTSADPAGATVPADAAPRPGGPHWTVFGMSAVSQGECTLRFELVRPWEKDHVPARSVDVSVTVRPR